jgi:hypothetical protein
MKKKRPTMAMFFFSPAKETFHQKQKSDFLGYSFSNITKISCRKLQGKIFHFLAVVIH